MCHDFAGNLWPTEDSSALPRRSGSQCDVADIVKMAVEDRKQRRRKEYRKKEIEDQMAELQKELEGLSEDSMFEPQWKTELRHRVEAAIEDSENTKSSQTNEYEKP